MVLDVRQINQQNLTPSVQEAAKNTPSDTNRPIVGGNAGTNTDGYQAQNSSTTEQTTQAKKRTEAQLTNALKPICDKTELSEEKIIAIITNIEGYTKDALLDLDQNELNRITTVFNDTVAAMQEDGIEINEENFEKAARGYLIQVKCGWDSVASFREANKKNSESVIQRLNRFFGCDFKKLSTEEKAKKLDAYFSRYFDEEIRSKLKNAKTEAEVEAIKQSVRTKQLTDFSKLLYNTSPEDRAILRDAIEFLAAKNRYKGYDSILKSFDTDAERTKLANSTTPEQIENWCTKEDQLGDKPTEEEQIGLVRVDYQHKDAKHIKNSHNYQARKALEFYTEETIEKLAEIKEKKGRGEALTEEEQELYEKDQFYRSLSTGEIIGTGSNNVISEEERNDLLHTINEDAYQLPTYRDVMEKVNEYIEQHPETLNMPIEDFIKLMDEVTNKNYSRIISGSTEPLAEPTDYVPSANQNQTTGINSDTTNNNRPESYTEVVANAQKNILALNSEINNPQNYNTENTNLASSYCDTSDLNSCVQKYGQEEGVRLFTHNNSPIQIVVEAFKNFKLPNLGDRLKEIAEYNFKTFLNANQQKLVLERVGFAANYLYKSADALCLQNLKVNNAFLKDLSEDILAKKENV